MCTLVQTYCKPHIPIVYTPMTQTAGWAYTLVQITPTQDFGTEKGGWIFTSGWAYTLNFTVHSSHRPRVSTERYTIAFGIIISIQQDSPQDQDYSDLPYYQCAPGRGEAQNRSWLRAYSAEIFELSRPHSVQIPLKKKQTYSGTAPQIYSVIPIRKEDSAKLAAIWYIWRWHVAMVT